MHYNFRKTIAHVLYSILIVSILFVLFHQFVSHIELEKFTVFRFSGLVSLVFALLTYQEYKRKDTRVTKGTKMVSPVEFNRRIKGDGIAIPCLQVSFFSFPWKKNSSKNIPLRIRKVDESVHMLIAGDSGTGKSALQHTILKQIAQRDEDRAVIYDPSMEFWERHGNSSRGDILLHPLEDVCPYWNITQEIRTPVDAAALTKSLIPDSIEGRVNFFEISPRKLLAKMLIELKKENRGVERLLRWLSDPEKIYDLVDGSALEVLIDKNAHGQRSGILATLAQIAAPLELLPVNDGRSFFSFTQWSREGAGWLFIGTRGAGERDALRPLISAWLDTVFSRLMEVRNGRPTWVFVDELPSLQRLPMLKTALHEGRKYNIRFVLGFQGRAQIEQLYGREAETLMSAPSTRIFLRSNEYAAAEWAAKNIGMPEQERDIESYTSSMSVKGNDSINLRTERRADYLVYPNEIQNLSKLTGYLRYDKYVVPIRFPYPDL